MQNCEKLVQPQSNTVSEQNGPSSKKEPPAFATGGSAEAVSPSAVRIALAGLLLILAMPAAAGPDPLGCFTRSYDRAHLARHPDQLVTAVSPAMRRCRASCR
jgi:hypothetical protein